MSLRISAVGWEGNVTSRFAESVRSPSADLSLRELLEQPVTELLGVGQDAATALQSIGVQTIFDLGVVGDVRAGLVGSRRGFLRPGDACERRA